MLGAAIREILKNHAPLVEKIGDKIYPTIAPQGTKPPALIYQIKSLPQYSRDGLSYDRSSVTILLLGKEYDENEAVAQLVRDAFEFRTGIFSDELISSNQFDDIDQDFVEEAKAHLVVFSATLTHSKTDPLTYHQLSVTTEGEGVVSLSSGKHVEGEKLIMAAIAKAGSQFVKFIANDTNETTNPVQLTMDSGQVWRAIFELLEPYFQYIKFGDPADLKDYGSGQNDLQLISGTMAGKDLTVQQPQVQQIVDISEQYGLDMTDGNGNMIPFNYDTMKSYQTSNLWTLEKTENNISRLISPNQDVFTVLEGNLFKDQVVDNDALIKNTTIAKFDGKAFLQGESGQFDVLQITDYRGIAIPTIDYDNYRINATNGELEWIEVALTNGSISRLYLQESNGNEVWTTETSSNSIFSDLDTFHCELLIDNNNLIPEKGTIEEDADIYWLWTTWKDEFTRDNKALAYDDDYVYLSYDCGFSYPNRIAFNDTANIGMSYIFDNGNILFGTKDHIYLSKDNLATYNEVIVRYPNGDIFTPIADGQNYRMLNVDRPVFINDIEYLVWGNYGRLDGFGSSVAAVYSSIDSGESITLIAQSPSPEINVSWRHTHAINYNPNDASFIMQTGDDGDDCFWNKIQHDQSNNTWSFEQIAAGTTNPDVQSYYKTVGMYFDDTYAYWGSDVTDNEDKRCVFKTPLADIADKTKYIPIYQDPAEVIGSFLMNGDGEFIAAIHNTTGNKGLIISNNSGDSVMVKNIPSIAQEYQKVNNKNSNDWWFINGYSTAIVDPKLGTLYIKIK